MDKNTEKNILAVQALISVQALVFDLAQLPEKVWLQKCNPGVFCSTPRCVVQLNCGSSFAVGRHLWTYPTLIEA